MAPRPKYRVASLQPMNWIKQKKKSVKWTWYKHRTRKRVLLQYDPKTKLGQFWDSDKNKAISEIKRISWL